MLGWAGFASPDAIIAEKGLVLPCLHADMTLAPGVLGLQPKDLWALVTATGPGIGTQQLALVAGDYSASAQHPLRCVHRVQLPTPQSALQVFTAGASAAAEGGAQAAAGPSDGMLRLTVHNIKAAMVGGFICPCSGARFGQAVPVAVVGMQHADGSLGMQLLELDMAKGAEEKAPGHVNHRHACMDAGAQPRRVRAFHAALIDPRALVPATPCHAMAESAGRERCEGVAARGVVPAVPGGQQSAA